MSERNMTPREIVDYLDRYVIGQNDAKKTIAVALRNRWRRMRLDEEMQREVTPKNILMIGSTGVGKTEISRRLARMMKLPFIKVEASKFTEVGFVGRDVESIVRDLAMTAMQLVREEENERNKEKIEAYVENKIIEKLLPPLPDGASEQKKADYEASFARMQKKLEAGELDHLKIEVEMPPPSLDLSGGNVPPEMANVQESIAKVLGGLGKKGKKKEVSIKEARKILAAEASNELLDEEKLKEKALEKVEQGALFSSTRSTRSPSPPTSPGARTPARRGSSVICFPSWRGRPSVPRSAPSIPTISFSSRRERST